MFTASQKSCHIISLQQMPTLVPPFETIDFLDGSLLELLPYMVSRNSPLPELRAFFNLYQYVGWKVGEARSQKLCKDTTVHCTLHK